MIPCVPSSEAHRGSSFLGLPDDQAQEAASKDHRRWTGVEYDGAQVVGVETALNKGSDRFHVHRRVPHEQASAAAEVAPCCHGSSFPAMMPATSAENSRIITRIASVWAVRFAKVRSCAFTSS